MKKLNISKTIMVGLGFVAMFIVGFYLSGMEDRKLASQRIDLVAKVQASRDAPIFAVIEREFPSDYTEFFDNAAALSVGGSFDGPEGPKLAYDFRQGFLTQLRQKHAHFIRNASPDAARAIQQATLDVLQSLSDKPELCARYAAFGGNGLSVEQAETIDVTPIIRVSVVTYESLAQGRDHPFENPVALPEDRDAVLAAWITQIEPNVGMQAAVTGGNWQHPDFCAASISLQKFILNDRAPATIRMLVDGTATILGN